LNFKGEIGRVISLSTGLDWTGATQKEIKVIRPDQSSFTVSGASVIVDDALNGFIHFITEAEHLTLPGRYFLQASLVDSSRTLYSPIESLIVEDVLFEEE
jgi:hypothetical protein